MLSIKHTLYLASDVFNVPLFKRLEAYDQPASIHRSLAQDNLKGRTDWLDPNSWRGLGRWHGVATRYQQGHVVGTSLWKAESIFIIVETVRVYVDLLTDEEREIWQGDLGPKRWRRGYRFVAFDLGGGIVRCDSYIPRYKTRAQVEAALREWVFGFDAVEHYRKQVDRTISEEKRHIERMEECLEELDQKETDR